MEDYYDSPEFQQLLNDYHRMLNERGSVFMEVEELIDIAKFYYGEGDTEKALEVLNILQQLYADDDMVKIFAATIALDDDEKGIEKAKEIIADVVDKQEYEYFLLQAAILFKEGKKEEAERIIAENVSQIYEEERDYFIQDFCDTCLHYGHNDLAEKWIVRCKDKKSIEYIELMVDIKKSGNNQEACIPLLNQLIDHDPYNTDYWHDLAGIYFLTERPQEALNALDYILAINPDDTIALAEKGSCLYDLDNYEAAIEIFKRCVALSDEHDTKGKFLLFRAYVANGQQEKAMEVFKKIMRNPSTPPEIYAYIAFSFVDMGAFQIAYELFSNSLPQTTEPIESAYAYYALCCYELQHFLEYHAVLKIALKTDPDACERVLGHLYPIGTDPLDYPNYQPRNP